jgi:hypothetical protein
VVEDVVQLEARNAEFVAACREEFWARLRAILVEGFQSLYGGTGQTWDGARYAADPRANPAPALWIDEVVVHLAGQTATASARTHSDSWPGRANRYMDTHVRRGGSWRCVHACGWPLVPDEPGRVT